MNYLDSIKFMDDDIREYARRFQDLSNEDRFHFRLPVRHNWVCVKQRNETIDGVPVAVYADVFVVIDGERKTLNSIKYACCVSCILDKAFEIARNAHLILLPDEQPEPNPKSPWYSHEDNRTTA